MAAAAGETPSAEAPRDETALHLFGYTTGTVDTVSRVLVVYLMGTKIAEDLTHPAHMNQAETALDEIEPRDYGLDVIAFVVRALPQGLAAVFTVADDTALTISQAQALFGRLP